ncbi:MAG TPA: LacI family DNA-binding transcriptional regulator [Pseudonocardia sp.]|nr:LacI family DNA-binding transcriptional regulator [Pseudonocardia sp.]
MAVRGRATIKDVAARAGVSTTTVSHVLSGRRPVSAATAERVRQAVAEIGYRPAAIARSMRTRRTETVALIVPDIANPFYPTVARGLHDALVGHGYRTLIGSTDGQRAAELGFLEDVAARSVDGIVLFGHSLDAEDLRTVVGGRVPIVLSSDLGTTEHDRVVVDDVEGAEAATAHLLAAGVTDIAFLSGPKGLGPGDWRLSGYLRALGAAGLAAAEDYLVRGDYTVESGRLAVGRLLAGGAPPRAVICANDLMAIGALRAAHEAGVAVPDGLAVVGFDDIDAAALVRPALTTVALPAYEIGRRSGELLLARMSGGPSAGEPAREEVLRTRLIVRESTPPVAAAAGEPNGGKQA